MKDIKAEIEKVDGNPQAPIDKNLAGEHRDFAENPETNAYLKKVANYDPRIHKVKPYRVLYCKQI